MRRIVTTPGLLLAATALAGCSMLNAETSDAMRRCQINGHTLLETASLPDGAILQAISRNHRSERAPRFPEYAVTGHPNGYADPPKVIFVLMQSQQNELILCEVRAKSSCSPTLTWFRRVDTPGFDEWEFDRTDAGQQVCVVE